MKKILFSLVALMMMSTASQAQKFYKAEELMEEGSKAQPNDEAKFKEAIEIMKTCIADPKAKNLPLLYHMLGEINSRMVNAEIEKLNSGKCDTTLFISALDEAIEAFTKSNEIEQTPDAKGKVKIKYLNPFEASSLVKYSGNKKRIKDMLKYYGYAANFENNRKNQDGALKYFKKTLDLPNNKVFTPEETAAILKKDKAYYNKIGYYTAMLAYQKKDWNTVTQYVDYAIAEKSSLHDGYLMKMGAQLAMGDTAKWVETSKQAIADMPDEVANCQNLLKYYDDHKMGEEAKKMADELIQKAPESKASWYTRGCVFMNTLKDYTKAREDFKKALEMDPNFTFAQFNMGCTFVNELTSIADKLEQDRSKVDKYNADMEKARGYYRKALPYFENTMILAPNKPNLWSYNLKNVYYNLQDGAVKAEMQKKEADMQKVMDGELSVEDFISKYNIQQTVPAE